jgi:hypothetical protein
MIFDKILSKVNKSKNDDTQNIIEIYPDHNDIIETSQTDTNEEEKNYNNFKYTIVLYLLQIQKNPVKLGIGYSNYLDERYTPEEITEYVIKDKYITRADSIENLKNILPTYTSKELKEILTKYNLPTIGDKQKLINRIEKNISLKELFEEFKKQSYIITKKGLELINENPQIYIYKKYFSHHDLTEYEQYYQNNKTNDMKKFTISYLKALGEKNIIYSQWFNYKWNSIRELSYIYYDYKEYDLALKYFMKLFICELSFWENSFYSINFERIISESYIEKLIKTVEILKLDIDELKDEFYICYDTSKVPLLIIPKEDMFKYFLETINGISIEKINKEIYSRITIPEELKHKLYYDTHQSIEELVEKIQLYPIYE